MSAEKWGASPKMAEKVWGKGKEGRSVGLDEGVISKSRVHCLLYAIDIGPTKRFQSHVETLSLLPQMVIPR